MCRDAAWTTWPRRTVLEPIGVATPAARRPTSTRSRVRSPSRDPPRLGAPVEPVDERGRRGRRRPGVARSSGPSSPGERLGATRGPRTTRVPRRAREEPSSAGRLGAFPGAARVPAVRRASGLEPAGSSPDSTPTGPTRRWPSSASLGGHLGRRSSTRVRRRCWRPARATVCHVARQLPGSVGELAWCSAADPGCPR